jgi:hypothetical protein
MTVAARKVCPYVNFGTSRNCNINIIFGFASWVNRKGQFQSYGMTGKPKWVHREFAYRLGGIHKTTINLEASISRLGRPVDGERETNTLAG